MKKIHEKSPCCQGQVRRFGKRRRQCIVCHKTWRVWRKKTGRKKLRQPFKLLLDYLENQNRPLKSLAKKQKLTVAACQIRLKQILLKYVKQIAWPKIPPGKFIIIADAFLQNIAGRPYAIFLIILRPINSNQAIIIPPGIRSGSEHTAGGWQAAFDQLPIAVKKRALALVCDGAPSLVGQAKKQGWILQRCHFHHRFRLNNYVRSGPLSRHRQAGIQIQKLTDVVLLNEDELKVKMAIKKLKLMQPKLFSQNLKTVVSGFVKHYQDYRQYLYYPQLNLPNTSNSMESLVSQVRGLQSKARGFRTLKSFTLWLEALLKFTKSITCNGKKNQPS